MRFFKKHKKDKKNKKVSGEVPDLVSEQLESEYTTTASPDAETDIKKVRQNPQEYVEVNIIRKSRVVDTFAVPITKTKIKYKKAFYVVDEKYIYLLPTKHGYLMPTSFYKEGITSPVKFLNTNKGITGKALALLYMEKLYATLLAPDEEKYNFFIVVLSIAILICFAIGCYFVFFHNGGVLP